MPSADKSTAENFFELLKGFGVDPLGFETSQKAAESWGDTLIDLERLGFGYGKSVETIRDEINYIAYSFKILQTYVVSSGLYQELHKIKGFRINFEEMISILELARDTFGPDEQQLLKGVQFQSSMMKNGSAFQGIFMRIIKLKKAVMSGDKTAIIKLKQEAMKLKSIARINLSLGETISGISSYDLDALLLFAESQLTTNPLGEKVREYNERQMIIRNMGGISQLQISQLDAEIGGVTAGMQEIQLFLLGAAIGVNNAIISMYALAKPDSIDNIVSQTAITIDTIFKKHVEKIDALKRENKLEMSKISIEESKKELNKLKVMLIENAELGLKKKYKDSKTAKTDLEISTEASSIINRSFEQSKYAKIIDAY